MFSLRTPTPDDAEGWFDFLVEQQAITYAGIVPADFVEAQQQWRVEQVPTLREEFANLGSARAVMAYRDDQLVGVAATATAPQQWEKDLGFTPPPASRQLARLYLAPSTQGTGLADELLQAVDTGEDLYLWLIDANRRAHRFYQRRGFVDLPESYQASESWGRAAMHRMVRRS